MVSSLPGKAMRTLVESLSPSVLKAEPGKLDIKRREPGRLPIVSLFKLAIMTLFSIFVLLQRH